ncbi:unnamed protein product [Prorocentrum cordatum]|uniref:RING-type domain-containing protein n=1 Tax=Prorocentrum cordatum TaxID=2364126 RepID=A0ABN9RHF9_9DINO|nr:unnamed protein product [Polarella glacialis]
MPADSAVVPVVTRGRPLRSQWSAAGWQAAGGGASGEARGGVALPRGLPRYSALSAAAEPPAVLADADLEHGRGALREQVEVSDAFWRAMHLVGWAVLMSSWSWGKWAELRYWLLFYLIGVVAEVGLLSLARICHNKLVQQSDWHVGPGFVKACSVFCCGFWLLALVLLRLRVLAVDAFTSVLAGLVMCFTVSSSGDGGLPGYSQAGGPAKPGTLEALGQVEFRLGLFDGSNSDGPHLSKECFFCLEEYAHKQAVIVTPCRHTMHRGCLEKWLSKSRSCPMCRRNLEVTPPTQQHH